MRKINLLDCTLRDGGYVNDWAFGEENIKGFINKIATTNVEFIELGFMKGDTYDKDKSIYPDLDAVKNVITPKNKSMKYFAMYDLSAPIPLDRFGKCDGTSLDGVRVIFKKNKLKEGLDASKELLSRGYIVSINFVSTDVYSDEEFIEAIEKVNVIKPYTIAIVDTFGSMRNAKFTHYVKLADKYLDKDIALSYHAHNNLQQAYTNATSFVELNLDREIVIDASVFGMGRGAGNLNLELFAEYMNENYKTNYHIVPMLEIMDEYLQEIYHTKFWGYSLPLYISGTLNVHPNYAMYMAERGTLTEKSLYEILKNIKPEDTQVYKKEIAEKYYLDYQGSSIDDTADIEKLKEIFEGKRALILAPGRSINSYKDDILKVINSDDVVSISVNFYNEDFKTDFLFSSNMRRYGKLDGKYDVKSIITSNMRDAVNKDYVINFYNIALDKKEIIDNAGLMAINLLLKLKVKDVLLAGMDGYNPSNPYVYSDESTHYDFSKDASNRNEFIKRELNDMKKQIHITFVTPSKYEFSEGNV